MKFSIKFKHITKYNYSKNDIYYFDSFGVLPPREVYELYLKDVITTKNIPFLLIFFLLFNLIIFKKCKLNKLITLVFLNHRPNSINL